MREFLAYGVCIILILWGIKSSLVITNEHRTIKYTLNRVLYYLSILLSFMIINSNLKDIIYFTINISSKYYGLDTIENKIIRVLLLVLVYLLINIMIYSFLKVVTKFIWNRRRYSNGTLNLLSCLFGAFKGCIIVIIMFVGINIFNLTIGTRIPINIFKDMIVFNEVESVLSNNFTIKSKEINTDNDIEFIPNTNVLIYYNGVTLEDGIRSTGDIDEKAIDLVKYKEKDIDKAKTLHVWVGSNIEYDFEKADRTLKNLDSGNSGAIEAWTKRRGICFDYACLYVAMARAVGLKVRLITGSAFDGVQYGPHAWNEVYLSDEDRWITVDPTFYLSGNYFDSKYFYDDHIKESIAGQW